MIEPNAHYELYDSRGREPGQHEQVRFGLSAGLAGSISSFDPLNRNSL
jgi:hypothetical protein